MTLAQIISMPPALSFALGGFGVALTILYGWTKLFDLLENNIRSTIRDEIGRWLLQQDDRSRHLSDLPKQFAGLFDTVFGKNHLTIRCFALSTFVSIFTFILLFFSVLGMDQMTLEYRREGPYAISLVRLMIVTVNAIPDYISLLETRWLLDIVRSKQFGMLGMSMLLIVDAILTIAITLTALIVFLVSFFWITDDGNMNLAFEIVVSRAEDLLRFDGMTYNSGEAIILVAVGTAFATSVWLWRYMLGAILVRAGASYRLVVKWMPIEERPLRSIGFVGGLVCAVCYLAWFLIASPSAAPVT